MTAKYTPRSRIETKPMGQAIIVAATAPAIIMTIGSPIAQLTSPPVYAAVPKNAA